MISSLRELVEKERVSRQQILDAKEDANKITKEAMEKAERAASEAEDSIGKTWKAKSQKTLEERRKLVQERFDVEIKRLGELARKNHKKAVDFVLKRAVEVKA